MEEFEKFLGKTRSSSQIPQNFLKLLLPTFETQVTSRAMLSIQTLLEITKIPAEDFWKHTQKLIYGVDYTQVYISRDSLKTVLMVGGWRTWYQRVVTIEMQHAEWLKCKLEQTQKILQQTQQKIKHKYTREERIYVLKNEVYSDTPIFKIGKTTDLHKRLSTYNTSSLSGVCVVYERTCMDSKLIESVVHFILEPFRCDRAREYFELDIKQIRNTIDSVVDFIDGFKTRLIQVDYSITADNQDTIDTSSSFSRLYPSAQSESFSPNFAQNFTELTSKYFSKQQQQQPASNA